MKFTLSILLLLMVSLCHYTYTAPLPLKNREGIIDLREVDFNNQTKVPLDMPWEFYWQKLFEPVDFENNPTPKPLLYTPVKNWTEISVNEKKLTSFGFATYRIRILTNADSPLMALYLPGVYSSTKVWVDGELIKEHGRVGKNEEETKHFRTDLTLPFAVKSDTIELIIQAANFYHKNGGIIAPPVISTSQQLLKEDKYRVTSGMLYIGSLGFIGTSFLFLYLFFWKKDKAILYFALFCLCWSYRELSANYAPLVELIPNLPWSINVRVEYLSLYLGSLMGSLFLDKIFVPHMHRFYAKLIGYVIGAFMLTAVLLPSHIYTLLLPSFFILMGINVIYIITVMVKGALSGKRESSLAIVGILLAFAVMVLHVFSFFGTQASNMVYIYTGYLMSFLLNSMLLGARFSKSFFKLESLQLSTLDQKEEISAQAEQMLKLNSVLNQRGIELTKKNKFIENINKTLEKKVAQRTSKLAALNNELDTFLYKSSHDLRRPVKSLLGLTYLANKTITDDDSKELFQKVEVSAQSMDKLLKRLGEINEIKDHIYTKAPFDVQLLVHKLTYDVKKLVTNIEGLDFQFDYPDVLEEDQVLFYKLLFEILKNSAVWIDYEVEAMVIKVDINQKNGRTKITVQDNGPGIDDRLINHVSAMYKVGNEKTKGHGLGLYIVDKILEKVKGHIKLKSKLDQGTKVTIEIPSH